MKLQNVTKLALVALLVLCIVPNVANAQYNGNFETGTMQNWGDGGDTDCGAEASCLQEVNTISAHSGNYGLEQHGICTAFDFSKMYEYSPSFWASPQLPSNTTSIEFWYKINKTIKIQGIQNLVQLEVDCNLGSDRHYALNLSTYNTATDWIKVDYNIESICPDPDGYIIISEILVYNSGELEVFYDDFCYNGIDCYIEPDTTPPASITNLANITTCQNITWSWDNPADEDFDVVQIFKDGSFMHNVTGTSDLWEGLSELTEYTFSSYTCDITGNCNTTWVNRSSTTGSCAPHPPPPVASFTKNRIITRVPQLVIVNDTSTNTPTSWNWRWGDGSNSTTQNATHSYGRFGFFKLNLESCNAAGCSDTFQWVVSLL